jgi:hypothetical protein
VSSSKNSEARVSGDSSGVVNSDGAKDGDPLDDQDSECPNQTPSDRTERSDVKCAGDDESNAAESVMDVVSYCGSHCCGSDILVLKISKQSCINPKLRAFFLYRYRYIGTGTRTNTM